MADFHHPPFIPVPLSFLDILLIVPDCKPLPYEAIPQVETISALLPKCVILYQLAEIGHFCCLFMNREGLNFFDPLGNAPDYDLRYSRNDTPYNSFTYLLNLMYKTGERVTYNEHAYQTMKSPVCGYWCAMRLLYSSLTNNEFHDIFGILKKNDSAIVELYYDHLQEQ
jgi:hypothetical protein